MALRYVILVLLFQPFETFHGYLNYPGLYRIMTKRYITITYLLIENIPGSFRVSDRGFAIEKRVMKHSRDA